ncbi:MAG TPA: EVE domain-containing protein [Terriglobales bacterium]|nr:EVE domain-containing protein [Terriglobales bacterium]
MKSFEHAVARLPKPVTLAEVKANKRFRKSPLVRQRRASAVPLTEQYTLLTAAQE